MKHKKAKIIIKKITEYLNIYARIVKYKLKFL